MVLYCILYEIVFQINLQPLKIDRPNPLYPSMINFIDIKMTKAHGRHCCQAIEIFNLAKSYLLKNLVVLFYYETCYSGTEVNLINLNMFSSSYKSQ
jgi:hypothetical protein